MKKFISALALMFALIMILSVPAGAYSSYKTYTNAISGDPLLSPDAYRPIETYNSIDMGLETALSDPYDIAVDDEMNVYIVDAANNAVIVLDRYYKHKFTLKSFTNEIGAPDSFASPRGVFITNNKYDGYGNLVEEGKIFICDTQNYRLVVFSRSGEFLYVLDAPKSELFDEDDTYYPVAVAVDKYNRIYVVSSMTTEGVIVLTSEGEFTGFIGAPPVTISLWDIIWRRFQTDAQKKQEAAKVPGTLDNIAVDEDGFVYVTMTPDDGGSAVASAIRSKSISRNDSPVKKLNAAGDEIMNRNGFFPPVGEIAYIDSYATKDTTAITGVSTIGDVALGEAGTWSITDTKRSKVYTYDSQGNLLFAFGDKGQNQLGNIGTLKAIAYQGDKLLVLDSGTSKSITVYERTEYGDLLVQAVADQLNREYDKAYDNWTEILKRNSNFDAAYVGIGQALYRSGKYEAALEHYQVAYDTNNWSSAYAELRKQQIEDIFLLIPVVIVVFCIAFAFIAKKVTKINLRAATSGEKITFGKELLYCFHILTHPFDGFWDLKHEKRGSLRAGLVIFGVTVLAFFYQAIGQGYLFNPTGTYSTIVAQLIGVGIPLVLFVVANWCLTTLFEGEGSFKDICIAVCYSLVPLPLLIIPATIFSNVVTVNEMDIVTLVVSLGFIWAGFLIFFGTMVTHDYSLGKNVIMIVCSIVGMAFIMFVALLFTTLLGKIVSFVTNIITEIGYRI